MSVERSESEPVLDLLKRLRIQAQEVRSRQEDERRSARAEGRKPEFVASAEELRERKAILDGVEKAFGMSGRAICRDVLACDQTLWAKWRAMTSQPGRESLDRLVAYASDPQESAPKARAREAEADEHRAYLNHFKDPTPVYVLSDGDGRVANILLFYQLFPWKNAVMRFERPSLDDQFVLALSALSLRRPPCRLVYIHHEPKKFAKDFLRSIRAILGISGAKRAIRSFAFIELPVDQCVETKHLAVWNFGESPAATCGYLWLTRHEQSKDGTRDDSAGGVRSPAPVQAVPYSRSEYIALRDELGDAVVRPALDAIDRYMITDWSDESVIEENARILLFLRKDSTWEEDVLLVEDSELRVQ